LHFENDESSTHEKNKEDESWLEANIPSIVKLGDLYRLGDHFCTVETLYVKNRTKL